MNKQECQNRATRARHAANVAAARVALYRESFGSADTLTQQAATEMDVAHEVAQKWERIAAMNPAARAAMIRRGSIPRFMFAY